MGILEIIYLGWIVNIVILVFSMLTYSVTMVKYSIHYPLSLTNIIANDTKIRNLKKDMKDKNIFGHYYLVKHAITLLLPFSLILDLFKSMIGLNRLGFIESVEKAQCKAINRLEKQLKGK